MLTIALVLILGLIGLLAIVLTAVTLRGAKVAHAIEEVERNASSILAKDRENDEQLVFNLISGMPVDECFTRQGEVRSRLLPTSNDLPWSAEDLLTWKTARKKQVVDAVHRRLMIPTFGAALGIIAVFVVAVFVLYEFQASKPNWDNAPSVESKTIPPVIDHTLPPPISLPIPTVDPVPGAKPSEPGAVATPPTGGSPANTPPTTSQTQGSFTSVSASAVRVGTTK